MRGYGTLQTMTALETLIDEVATALKLDPIEFRRRNLLQTGGRTMTGNPWTVSIRTPEILDKLEQHPIWRDRAEESAARAWRSWSGPASPAATKDYGTGADCSLGRLEMDPRMVTFIIYADAVEMGNGIGTALANRVARPSSAAWPIEVTVAQVDKSRRARARQPPATRTSMKQAEQDAAAKNPRWVPEISSATSASIGAHVGTQAAAQAARVIFRFGLWPAALELWGIAPDDPRRILWEEAFWQDEQAHPVRPAAAVAAGGCGARRMRRMA